MITYLITTPDQAGQCRIVARRHGKVYQPNLIDYQRQPSAWHEAGHMTSAGKLVSFNGLAAHFAGIQACEPLMAGTIFTYEENV